MFNVQPSFAVMSKSKNARAYELKDSPSESGKGTARGVYRGPNLSAVLPVSHPPILLALTVDGLPEVRRYIARVWRYRWRGSLLGRFRRCCGTAWWDWRGLFRNKGRDAHDEQRPVPLVTPRERTRTYHTRERGERGEGRREGDVPHMHMYARACSHMHACMHSCIQSCHAAWQRVA